MGGRGTSARKGIQYGILLSVFLGGILILFGYLWLHYNLSEFVGARPYLNLLLILLILMGTALLWLTLWHRKEFRAALLLKTIGNLTFVTGVLVEWLEPGGPPLAAWFLVPAFAFWMLAFRKLKRALRSTHSD